MANGQSYGPTAKKERLKYSFSFYLQLVFKRKIRYSYSRLFFVMWKIKLAKYESYFLFGLTLSLFLFTFLVSFIVVSDNEFPELAWSFIHGQTYFLTDSLVNPDIINFNSHLYWHMPPFPAIILMPLIFLLQGPLDQSFVTFTFNLALAILIYFFVRKKFNFSKTNSLWLIILYLFSSIYVSSTYIIGPYWYAQTIVTLLLFLSLYEFYGLRRFWLIGIFLGLTLLTRYTAILNGLFFALIIIFNQQENLKKRIWQLFLLSLPVVCAGVLILGYNYLRFNTPLETGYQIIQPYAANGAIHQFGFFHPYYIPTNFYYYFLESFSPIYADPLNAPGVYHLKFPYIGGNGFGAISFFLISPIFIYLYQAKLKIKEAKYAIITSGVITLVLLNYYYNGYLQLGPRYLNDALPLLFVILLYVFQAKGLRWQHKLIITLSAFLNIYLWYGYLLYGWPIPHLT